MRRSVWVTGLQHYRNLQFFWPGDRIIVATTMHYNFVRPHMGLDGRTPAEAAGIKIVGRDKWMTIIGNAGMYRLAEARRTANAPAA